MEDKYYKYFNKAILSGILISISAYFYSTLGGSILGALLFSFGLIAIVHYRLFIFTGTAGFVESEDEVNTLLGILLGNVIGCFASACVLYFCADSSTQLTFIENAIKTRTIEGSLYDIIRIAFRALMCGIIMTVAVKFARKGLERGLAYFLPLLLGVPIFLLSGFFHSIVDAFYISYGIIHGLPIFSTFDGAMTVIVSWFFVVFGNFIGCNIPRLTLFELKA